MNIQILHLLRTKYAKKAQLLIIHPLVKLLQELPTIVSGRVGLHMMVWNTIANKFGHFLTFLGIIRIFV